MPKVSFVLEKRENENNGTLEDALIKKVTNNDGTVSEEQWCTVPELDQLFNACSKRWAENGWDLNKLITAVNECSFD